LRRYIEAVMIRIASNDHFQNFMLGIILLNGACLMIVHADQPE